MNRISLALVISVVFCVAAQAATASQLKTRSASLSATPVKPFTAAERHLFERASQTWGEANQNISPPGLRLIESMVTDFPPLPAWSQEPAPHPWGRAPDDSLPTGAATAANQATEISSLATIATNTGAAIPAGTAVIGKVGIDQTTPGTTNLVALSAETTKVIGTSRMVGNVGGVFDAAVGAAAPANALQIATLAGSTTGGLLTQIISCDQKAIYDASTNGSTELVALSSGKTIYVCGKTLFSGGTANVKLIYVTGTAAPPGPII